MTSFEGVSDSRHPGPGAREGGSAGGNLRSVFRRSLCPALSDRFARNGGYGSIEESEILNLSPIAEGFGVISGCAFLHCKKGTKADLNTAPEKVAAFVALKAHGQIMIRPTWLKLGRPLGWADGRTVYNHSSGVAAKSRELPSNGPKAALCYYQ